jgi:hypothetical protein
VQIVFLLVLYAIVVVCCVYLHCNTPRGLASAESRYYRQQITLFAAMFVLLTAPQTYQQIQFLADPTFDFSDFTAYFGNNFTNWMGVGNAVVWGLSRTCLRTCISKFCLDSDLGAEEEVNLDTIQGLEIPLLQARYNTGSSGSRSSSSNMSRGSSRHGNTSSGEVWKDSDGYERQTIPLATIMAGTKIGMGAFGVVYKGTYDNQTVAIKEVDRGQVELAVIENRHDQ